MLCHGNAHRVKLECSARPCCAVLRQTAPCCAVRAVLCWMAAALITKLNGCIWLQRLPGASTPSGAVTSACWLWIWTAPSSTPTAKSYHHQYEQSRQVGLQEQAIGTFAAKSSTMCAMLSSLQHDEVAAVFCVTSGSFLRPVQANLFCAQASL